MGIGGTLDEWPVFRAMVGALLDAGRGDLADELRALAPCDADCVRAFAQWPPFRDILGCLERAGRRPLAAQLVRAVEGRGDPLDALFS
jgi:hypothetical protein